MGQTLALVGIATAVLGLVVNVIFAFGVAEAAVEERRAGRGLLFVGGFGWFLATLVGGPVTAGLFWVMHYSTLRSPFDVQGEESSR